MAIETVAGTDLKYYLIAYDEQGQERTGDPEGVGFGRLLSQRVREDFQREPVTDVFIMSHGWKGDLPAARAQYNAWIGAMARNEGDRQRMREVRPDFHPLLIGFHWPSLPWGDEDLGGVRFFDAADAPALEARIDDGAARIADTGPARAALRTIFTAAQQDLLPEELPEEVRQAYLTLNREAGLGGAGVAGAPDADREPFDPEQYYQTARLSMLQDSADEEFNFGEGGGSFFDGLLSPLRQLSFWKMKARARTVGEGGGAQLLAELQRAAAAHVKFHLMGHSFGCIVVSAMLTGPHGQGQLVRPVDSLVLVQGALSLWSYCESIAHASGQPGYFRSLIADRRVRGPIITTRSRFDRAVGRYYPIGAGLAGKVGLQLDFDPRALPQYGGIGAFGIQGPGLEIEDVPMKAVNEDYGFAPGKIYNLESSDFISKIADRFSGAHSDIAKPEVAHAVWEAARVS